MVQGSETEPKKSQERKIQLREGGMEREKAEMSFLEVLIRWAGDKLG